MKTGLQVWRATRSVFLRLAVALALLGVAPDADAAFPGQNGRIAFTSNRDGDDEIYTVAPDGSDAVRLTNEPGPDFASNWSADGQQITYVCEYWTSLCKVGSNGGGPDVVRRSAHALSSPTWSPDSGRIAFSEEVEYCDQSECGFVPELAAIDSDGTDFTWLTGNEFGADFANWSPDGSRIAFSRGSQTWTINPDGTGRTTIPGIIGGNSSWSPDGARIAYERWGGAGLDIYVANADGTNEVRLTNSAVYDVEPAWSPDGQKIAFSSNEGGDYEIFVMNADGSGRQAVTSNSVNDGSPDWQPIPINGYARPKGATPFQVWLAVAYRDCSSSNREHGAPLVTPSCSPPEQASDYLTVGTLDANGVPAKSIGTVQAFVKQGNVATPADEADVELRVSVSDVRSQTDLSDYTGELSVESSRRITDKLNSPTPAGPGAGTTQDLPFAFDVPCSSTSDTAIGSVCSVTTTADTLVPGQVREGARSNWQLGRVLVMDGGTDADASTAADNTLFMDQGLFVP